MQQQPRPIDRRSQQGRIDAGNQATQRVVCRHHDPTPIDRQSRIGLLARQHPVDCPLHAGHRGIGQTAHRKVRRVARGHQQPVPVAERQVHPLGQP